MTNRIDARKTRETRSFIPAKTLVLAGFAVLLTLGISSLALYTRTAATQELDKTPTSSEFPAGDMSFSSLEAAIASVRMDNQPDEPTAQTKLLPGDGIEDAEFGYNVAISGDTAIVSASAEPVDPTPFGAVYVFVRSGSTWTQQQKIVNPDYEPKFASTDFGTSVAISGNNLVIGNPTARVGGVFLGSYFIYTRTGTTWNLQQRINEPSRDTRPGYAQSAAIVDGRIFIGDPSDGVNSGCVYVYSMTGTQQQKITASDGTSTDFFGYSLAISGDRLVIGANLAGGSGTNPGPGAAYVFDLVEGAWIQQQKLVANGGSVGDSFGHSVAISADAIVVGANTSNSARGSAYVFVRNEGSWVFEQRLTAPGGQAGDNFGEAAVIIENRVIVGMPGSVSKTAGGSIYIFDRCAPIGTNPTRVQAFDTSGRDDFGLSLAFSGTSLLVGGDDQAYVIPQADFGRPAAGAQCVSEIIVNETGDQPDFDLEDDFCDADMNQSGRQCTLRAAIQTANDLPGPDTINFDIPGGGVRTISPASALPAMTGKVDIDGTTQPGYSTQPLIEIRGSLSTPTGLEFAPGSDASTLLGISILGFSERGVLLLSNNNKITKSHIGLNATGLSGAVQRVGVAVRSSGNHIGEPNDGNLIGYNSQNDILIEGAGATGNFVRKNIMGYYANDELISDKDRAESAIKIIDGASGNFVGANTEAEFNSISGGLAAVEISRGSNDNKVSGNNLSFSIVGVLVLNSSRNQIGGESVSAANNEGNTFEENVFGVTLSDEKEPEQSLPGRIRSALIRREPMNTAGVTAADNKIFGNLFIVEDPTQIPPDSIGIFVSIANDTMIGNGQSGFVNTILDCSGAGIVVAKESLRTRIEANRIGVGAQGAARANKIGIRLAGSGTEVRNNIISGNTEIGLVINRLEDEDPVPTSNTVDNNWIGTNVAGTAQIPNGDGMVVDGRQNTITNNVISGNTIIGLDIRDNQNTITNNRIGTDVNGNIDNGNKNGLLVTSSNNTIRNNTVSGNETGIGIGRNPDTPTIMAENNIVQGNTIGTNRNGTGPVANDTFGIVLFNGARTNLIGGPAASHANVISGNGQVGIILQTGIASGATPPVQNKIQGNFIGTSLTGNVAIPNVFDGIVVSAASSTLIGGITTEIPGARNIISGNGRHGISLIDGAISNRISGNYIGTGSDGVVPLGNVGNGIRVGNSCSGTIIGGPEQNAGNTIAYNGVNGISLSSDAGNNNIIDPNRIFGNVLRGIDLGENGFTPNDPTDADVGPNKLQNYPTFTLSLVGGDLIVNYQVDSAPQHSTYGGPGIYVEFFEADATGAGRDFLGSDHYLLSDYTNGTPGTRQKNLGNAVALGITAGDLLTATATDAEGNSSEFTPAVNAPGGAPGFEGDVAPRPNGDGTMGSTDVTQLRRFVSGLDTPNPATNEVQRIDCAPRSTFGDGVVNSTDVVQARRYVGGLDPQTPAGGPASRSMIPDSIFIDNRNGSFQLFERIVSIGEAEFSGTTVLVPIELTSQGNEVALSFTLEYDPSILADPQITLGNAAPAGSILTVNTRVPGRIGVLIDSSQPMPASGIPSGIVVVAFKIAAKADQETAISLTDSSAVRAVSDSFAHALPVVYRNAVLKVALSTDK